MCCALGSLQSEEASRPAVPVPRPVVVVVVVVVEVVVAGVPPVGFSGGEGDEYGESENRQRSTSLKEASNPEVTKPLQERTKVPMSKDKGWSSARAELWHKREEN